MDIYASNETETLIQNAGNRAAVTSLTIRRSPALPLNVRFVESGAVVDPGSPEIYFVLKSEGKYDEDPPVLLNGSWTKSGSGSTALWTTTLNLVTTALDALFVVDGDDSNDISEVTLMGELVWIIDGEQRSSGRISVTITNNVYRGDETPVEETAAPGTYLATAGNNRIRPELAITTLTELRAYVTDGVPRPHLIAVNIPGKEKLWLVQDGTGADNGDWRIRPDDYVETDNEVEIISYL